MGVLNVSCRIKVHLDVLYEHDLVLAYPCKKDDKTREEKMYQYRWHSTSYETSETQRRTHGIEENGVEDST